MWISDLLNFNSNNTIKWKFKKFWDISL
jgi:hypothetical protein